MLGAFNPKSISHKNAEILKRIGAKIDAEPALRLNYTEYSHQVRMDQTSKPITRTFFEIGSRPNKPLFPPYWVEPGVIVKGISSFLIEIGIKIPDREWSEEEIDSIWKKVEADKRFKLTPYYGLSKEDIVMAMNELQKRGNGGKPSTALMQLPLIDGWTENQIATIKSTVAPNATNEELVMFLTLSKKYDLDPFRKEIMFLKFNGQVSCYTGKDGYFKAAHNDPGFAGIKSGVVKEGDDFEADFENCTVKHKIGATRGKIRGAWAIAYHKDPNRPPVMEWAEFDEYNRQDFTNWKKYPSTMIQKVAEIHALKKQFQISGLRIEEEDGELSTEERQEQIRRTLMAPQISEEERVHRVRIGRLLRSFHHLGISTEQIEQYLECSIADADDADLSIISEIGKEVANGRGTWDELAYSFGSDMVNEAIDIQAQPPQPQPQSQPAKEKSIETFGLPDMDNQPWPGDKQSQPIQPSIIPAGNGKEKLARNKIKAKLEAIYPHDTIAQNDWLGSLFVTSIEELDLLNLETLEPILNDVEALFEQKASQK